MQEDEYRKKLREEKIAKMQSRLDYFKWQLDRDKIKFSKCYEIEKKFDSKDFDPFSFESKRQMNEIESSVKLLQFINERKYETFEDLKESCKRGYFKVINRMDEEIKLFKDRKWEPYILLLLNTIPITKSMEKHAPAEVQGSAMDSFIIRDEIKPVSWGFINDKKAKEILFYDALKIDLHFKWNGPYFNNISYTFLMLLINLEAARLNLFIQERPLKSSREDTISKLIVISKKKLSEEEMNIIEHEKRESTDEEAKVLRDQLIIRTHLRNT